LQQSTAGASLAQNTFTDRRNFFWRAFGRTQYAVGPGTVYQMAARLGVTLKKDGHPETVDSDNARFVDLLAGIAARQRGPVNGTAFKACLIDEAGQDENVAALINYWFPELAHISALPRE
jgi:hypothetical protein